MIEEELKKDIFDLDLMTIIKNISDAILLILIDLTDLNNYSRLSLFLNIFLKENRMIYLGIFVVIISLFCLLLK